MSTPNKRLPDGLVDRGVSARADLYYVESAVERAAKALKTLDVEGHDDPTAITSALEELEEAERYISNVSLELRDLLDSEFVDEKEVADVS